MNSRTFVVLAAAVAVSGLGACAPGSARSPVERRASALAAAYTFAVTLPQQLKVTDVALSASGSLAIDDRVAVTTPDQSLTSVASTGTGPVDVGADAHLGANLFGQGPIHLRDRSHVSGAVNAGTTLKKESGVVVSGPETTGAALQPFRVTSWTVTFPPPGKDVNVAPDSSGGSIPAGSYGALTVGSRASLKLGTGTYFFTSFDLEPQATLKLDLSAGPLTIYVSAGPLIHRGTLAVTGDPIDFLLGYAGGGAVVLEAPFNGTFVAPAASVRLATVSGGYTGAFFARDLEVSPDNTITYRQALPILAVSPPASTDDCMAAVRPRLDLTGRAREVAFQADINRVCWIPGIAPCASTIAAKENADAYAAALKLVNQGFSPAQYLALVRDRVRKHRRADDDAAYAAALCSGHDADGDWIVDGKDACPGTADLAATDDRGCPTSLPPAPDATVVQQTLAGTGFVVNPLCKDAPMPREVFAGGVFLPTHLDLGAFIFAQRITDQPPGCPVWYELDVETHDPATPGAIYSLAFMDREEVPILFGGALGDEPVRDGFIQFEAHPGDAGTRGRLVGEIGKPPIRVRVRVMNGAGMHGPWSDWKFTTPDDCQRLHFTCG